MTKAVKRLYDIEIDEISLVDRPANQHGVVAIAKRHQEEDMPGLFDADGDEVNENELEVGDYVYDEDGNEFVVTPDDDEETTGGFQEQLAFDDEYDDEPMLVGKAATDSLLRRGQKTVAGWRSHKAGETPLSFADEDFTSGHKLRGRAVERAGKEKERFMRNRPAYIAGATGGTVGAAEGHRRGRRGVHKSLGSEVYEELSKALGQDDRDQVISKMADQVEIYKSQAEQAMALAEELAYERELEAYTEIAKGYNLPVDPTRLGQILKNAADTLPDEDLADLDRLLQAQSEMYEEIGTNGSMATSNVMEQVNAMALQTVGKADISESEAVVALFAANPAAYDEYLTEQRG